MSRCLRALRASPHWAVRPLNVPPRGCRADIYANSANLLAPLAQAVGGPPLLVFVCVDGAVVLAGSVLTACVGGGGGEGEAPTSHLNPPTPTRGQLRGRRGPRAAPRA